FTKVYKKYIWSGKCSNGSDCSKNDDCADKKCNLAYYAANDAIPNDDISSDQAKTGAVAPTLRAVTRDDKGRVLGQDSNASHNFSISTVQQSKTEGEVIGVSPVVATVAFYAYNPNGNQMPLRFVGVDWDNKLQPDKNIQVSASLKNHKPFCEPEKVCAGDKTLSCSGDNQCGDKKPCQINDKYNFGDSQDACIGDDSDRAGYFYYSNVYTCKGSSSKNWKEDALGPGQGACVYQPRVAVRDNWGWWSSGQYDDCESLISGQTGSCSSGKTGWQDYSAMSAGKTTGVRIIVKPKSQ
ncbi:MAG: hypothetical protein HY973_00440, partial [Candidatus Kerfeldbacteria bacterium]|nr:hypothetical protein [Candidatus Kerfeldbacteria bacterium]